MKRYKEMDQLRSKFIKDLSSYLRAVRSWMLQILDDSTSPLHGLAN